jgi:hypothetical protein
MGNRSITYAILNNLGQLALIKPHSTRSSAGVKAYL